MAILIFAASELSNILSNIKKPLNKGLNMKKGARDTPFSLIQ